MPVRMTKAPILLIVALVFALVTLWGQAPAKNWKDRAEYDLYDAATKATDNAKKIEILNNWAQKYPTSDYKMERLQLMLIAYNAQKQFDKVLETGSEILEIDAKNLQTLVLMTSAGMQLPKITPEQTALVQKAARALTTDLDSMKPAGVADDAWEKSKPEVLTLAHTTLGYLAMQQKQNAEAEKEFTAALKANPNNGQVSYWLGTVILAQRNPDTQVTGLYHIARAASYTGPNAYPDAARKAASDFLTKAYTTYHGSAEGLDEVRKIAAANAFPPEGFKIKSSVELQAEDEEAFKRANPMLALWQTVKKELTGATGTAYFEGGVKGALLPGGAGGVTKFKATLVAAKPPKNPKELVVAVQDEAGDATLQIVEEALVGSAPVGTVLEFEGVPVAYSTSPYMLTFEVEKEQLTGWPAAAAPAKKAPGAAKKAAPAPAKK